jgi:hypothetical protein
MTRCAVPAVAKLALEWYWCGCDCGGCCILFNANTEVMVVLLETSLDEEKSVKSAGTVVLLDEKECTSWGEACCCCCDELLAPLPFVMALVLSGGGGGHGDTVALVLLPVVAELELFVFPFERPNGCCETDRTVVVMAVCVVPLLFMLLLLLLLPLRLLVVNVATVSMTDCCTQTRCNC